MKIYFGQKKSGGGGSPIFPSKRRQKIVKELQELSRDLKPIRKANQAKRATGKVETGIKTK